MESNLEEVLVQGSKPTHTSTTRILISSILSFIVMVFELGGGCFSLSLVIMTDALNTFLDVSLFVIEYICSSLSHSPGSKMSYGYYRTEILGSMMSIAIVTSLSIWLVYESIKRIVNPEDIDSDIMVLCAGVGFIYNLVIWLLIGHKTANRKTQPKIVYINMKTKHTHFLLDLLESVVIIAVSLIIKVYPDYKILDPVCTLVIILITFSYLLRAGYDCILVLMERAPVEINLISLKKDLKDIEGVTELHDLHVWSLSLGKTAMSCHMISENHELVLEKAIKICKEKYLISNTTIQIEQPCEIHNLDCFNSLRLK